jgi:hypothetical protein
MHISVLGVSIKVADIKLYWEEYIIYYSIHPVTEAVTRIITRQNERKTKELVIRVGFEPTPSFPDQDIVLR